MQRTIALHEQLALVDGYTATALPSVVLTRAGQPLAARSAVLYEPTIVVICQGSKRGYLGDEVFEYNERQLLVLAVPMPFMSEVIASPEKPLLGIGIRIDLVLAAEIALALEEHQAPNVVAPRPMMSSPLDDAMADTLARLLDALQTPAEAQILGPSLLREIHYRVLSGAQGAAMRAAILQGGPFGRIAKALRRIHAEYHGDLDVGSLARDAGMSVPVFHSRFKAVTSTSPIQYLKSTRLHHARLLMIRSGETAASACARVGYESQSQFSREFKRLFGRTPHEEAVAMKDVLGLRAGAP